VGDVYFRVAYPATIVVVVTALTAVAVLSAAGSTADGVFFAYLGGYVLFALVTVFFWSWHYAIKLAIRRADRPLSRITRRLRIRLPMLLIPVILSPLFFTCFTVAKTGIAYLVGFRWDRPLAELDRVIFGADPWVYTHDLFGPYESALLADAYLTIWLLALVFVQVVVALCCRARTASLFFATLYGSWMLGGLWAAYALSSAGPVFAQLADPSLGADFAPLRRSLSTLLSPDNSVLVSQDYLLRDQTTSHVVSLGGGISAMPSMHIATAILYVLMARRTILFFPALTFVAVIWIGSVHFGYHYATDGALSLLIVLFCWRAAERFHDRTSILFSGRVISILAKSTLRYAKNTE
jgi:hypothetical protein